MELKRVVVTGLGTINPLGQNISEYWDGLRNGVSGAGLITRFDASKFKTKFACEIKNYDSTKFFDRKEVKRLDPFTQYALIAAAEAVIDSGINKITIDPLRVGVIWGTGVGGISTFEEEIANYVRGNGEPRFNPFFIPKMIGDIAAGMISMKYGFMGPNFATTSACASSTNALIDAFNYIRWGKTTIFLAGGSEAAVAPSAIAGFNAMHALSVRNDDPGTASRPFDVDRDGFVMAEGSGCIVLEEYEHAINRGAKIYAELVGSGLTADAHHLTAPHPEGLGAYNVMRLAVEDAGIQPEQIDYINVHGTATLLGDIAESLAILKVFGEHAYELNISSTKSMTGHLLGAAGAVESIASILAIKYGIVPPTINHFNDDTQIDNRLNLTFNKAQEREVNYALSNTFGFGGHNATVIFKKI